MLNNMTYKFLPAAFSGLNLVKAEQVGSELLKIEKIHGSINPESVVREARSKNSVLHTFFTWDDTEAAKLHRLREAGDLIRSVRIVPVNMKDPPIVRAFVSIIEDGERNYVSTARGLTNEQWRKQILATALKELEDWRERYENLEELSELVGSIRKFSVERKELVSV